MTLFSGVAKAQNSGGSSWLPSVADIPTNAPFAWVLGTLFTLAFSYFTAKLRLQYGAGDRLAARLAAQNDAKDALLAEVRREVASDLRDCETRRRAAERATGDALRERDRETLRAVLQAVELEKTQKGRDFLASLDARLARSSLSQTPAAEFPGLSPAERTVDDEQTHRPLFREPPSPPSV